MNVQNIPRKDTVIKQAFIPKLDALVFADYSQIELRLLAYYMAQLGDTSMVDVINAGTDLHDASAKAALRLTGNLTDDQRQVGKTLNFSIVYGGGKPTIKKQLDVSWNQAGELLDNYHRRWPGIQLVQATILQVIASRAKGPDEPGYITTLWGRHLHPESDHKALNALVQGCAADLMRFSIVKVHEFLTGSGGQSHLVSSVHDELIVDAVLREVPLVADVLPRLMDYNKVSLVVAVDVDVEWSQTNWAEKTPYGKEIPIAA